MQGLWKHALTELIVCAMAVPLSAATTYWQADPSTPASWLDPANWTAGVPFAGQDACLDNGGTALISSGTAAAQYLYTGFAASGTVWQAGGDASYGYIYLGNNAGSSGYYNLSGSGTVRANGTYVGVSGVGEVVQTGGYFCGGSVILGQNAGSCGSYYISGASSVFVASSVMYIGKLGGGMFVQDGAAVTLSGLMLSGTYELKAGTLQTSGMNVGPSATFIQSGGSNVGASSIDGTYKLSGGTLFGNSSEVITGLFLHSGGTNTVTSLSIPRETGSYVLSGGTLSAGSETIGTPMYGGGFSQTGGVNNAGDMVIERMGGLYQLQGGALRVGNLMLLKAGTIDFGGLAGSIALADGVWADMSAASIVNSTAATMTAGVNSVAIFPRGFDPYTQFGGYTSQGITHVSGTTLVVPAGMILAGQGDFVDHVICQGAVSARAGQTFNLRGGLEISGTRIVNLNGDVYVNDWISGIDGGQLTAIYLRIGEGGSGRFVQTGGTVTAGVRVGRNALSSTQYELDGGTVTASSFGFYANGVITQNGGVFDISDVGTAGGGVELYGTWILTSGTIMSHGTREYLYGRIDQYGGAHTISGEWQVRGATYQLSGGQLSMPTATLYSGTVTQTGGRISTSQDLILTGAMFLLQGGTLSVGSRLSIAPSGTGALTISGTGGLTARYEDVGGSAGGIIQQTGGVNVVDALNVYPKGRYIFSGGQLTINQDLACQGVFDFGGGNVSLAVPEGRCFNFSGTILNAQSATLIGMPNSMIILPRGFDPATQIGSIQTQGLYHVAGTDLVVPDGVTYSFSTTFPDHVQCMGTLVGAGTNVLNLGSGLTVQGAGRVDLGNGSLTVSDTRSGMASGSLTAKIQTIGDAGAGAFTQDGGTNTATSSLVMGAQTGSSGTYLINGGTLTSPAIIVGRHGTAHFTQNGGSVVPASYMTVGEDQNANAAYDIYGGQLKTGGLNVGRWSTGAFTQHSGTVTAASVGIGDGYSSAGTYNLIDGVLWASNVWVATNSSRSATYTQTGGLLLVGTLTVGLYGSGTCELRGMGQIQAVKEDIGDLTSLNARGWFYHSAGLNTVTGQLSIGNGSLYQLSGSGTLIASAVAVVRDGRFEQLGGSAAVSGSLTVASSSTTPYRLVDGTLDTNKTYIGSNVFSLQGGRHTTAYMSVSAGATYEWAGGELDFGGLAFRGKFDLKGQSRALNLDNTILDFAGGTVLGGTSSTLAVGPNSLVILAPGQDIGPSFASYANAGLTHVTGTTLSIPSSSAIVGTADLSDRVSCQGSLSAAPAGYINLANGVNVPGGSVNLGAGTLTVIDSLSAMSSGTLTGSTMNVGYRTSGQFTQSGGQCQFDRINLGLLAGGTGATGSYIQTGGDVSTHELLIAIDHFCPGTYTISGGSLRADRITIRPVGCDCATGTLAIASPSATVSVGTLFLVSHGRITAVPGSSLHVFGDLLADYALTTDNNSGLANLNLVIDGGPAQNMYLLSGNAIDLYGLGALTVGGTQQGHVRITGRETTFPGSFRANSLTVSQGSSLLAQSFTVRVTGATGVSGTYAGFSSDSYFSSLAISASGCLQAAGTSRFLITGNFTNASQEGSTWDTTAAKLVFQGGGSHTLQVAGAGLAPLRASYSNNFAWGTLSLAAGNSLVLQDGNSTPGGAMYVGVLDLAGGLAQIGAITGNGMDIIYDPKLPANAYLGG
ncbi:MAG: beta strand repeat-containing protein, partial [Phycisphaerae bacterium]